MNVKPERAIEQNRRDEKAVRADHDRVRRELDRVVERRRLRDGDAEPLGNHFRRRRRDAPSPPRRLVRPRQELDDLKVCRESLEDVGAERRGRGNRDPAPGHR